MGLVWRVQRPQGVLMTLQRTREGIAHLLGSLPVIASLLAGVASSYSAVWSLWTGESELRVLGTMLVTLAWWAFAGLWWGLWGPAAQETCHGGGTRSVP